MSRLAPITTTATPRPDVLAGSLADNHFAAQLDKIVRDPEHYAVYGDPDQFFALTYPTEGLRQMLAKTFGRLSQASGDDGEHGVLRAETSFGGGKTHSLIAAYHLAKGARPPGVEEFLDPGLLPTGAVQVAAVVGDALDPVNGLTTAGHKSFTLWGEVAAQLGPEAWTALKQSDATRTAPGTETLRNAFGGKPTLVIIDEIAQHLRQVSESGDEDVRRSASQVPVFLKNLFELAMGEPGVAVIITLASSSDAYGRETNDIQELLDEVTGGAQQAIDEAQSVLARSGRVIQPASDSEIAEILKRRLFETIDAGAARAAGDAYRDLYERIGATAALTGGAEHPATYGDAVAASYPFHPELIRVLDKRLGDIPNFQRARGALKLLAEVVAGIWEAADETEIINAADVDFDRPAVLNHLTVGIDRSAFEGVAKVDFVGPSSHAAHVDGVRFAGRAPFATRSCRTVFLHSLELKSGVGAGEAEYLLGTLTSDDEPEVIREALVEAERVCWHLTFDGSRWRFHTEPNVNKIIEDEKRNIPNSTVSAETQELVAKAFATEGQATVVHFPESPGAISDEPRLQVAVLHYDQVTVVSADADSPPHQIVDMREHSGASGSLRANRNGTVFVVADTDQTENLKDRVRTVLAVEKLANDSARLGTFSAEVRDRVLSLRDRSRLDARVAVTRCYKHVYFPWKDASAAHLRHRELPAEQQGEAKSAVRPVLQLLRDEAKLRTEPLATNWLKTRAWSGENWTTCKDVADWFWRDHAAPIVLDKTLITDAMRTGIRAENWVYYDTVGARAYTAEGATPNVELAATAELMTLGEATTRGLLTRQPTLADLLSSVPAAVAGPVVRAALESKCGGEPTKSQVADLLTEAVRQEKLVVLDQQPSEGVKALGVKEIKERSLDTFHVLTRVEAERIGIVFGTVRRSGRVGPHTGPTGVALQKFLDELTDKGRPLTSMSASVIADAARGTSDSDLLALALGQLPRHNITVRAAYDAEFPNVSGGLSLEVSASKADYQSINNKVSPLLKIASGVEGSLALDVSFNEPVSPESPDLQQVATVLRNLAPSEVTIEGTLQP